MISLFEAPRSRIVGAIRKEFSFSAIAKAAKEAAISQKKGPKGGKRYNCANCGDAFGNVQVDHIETVVPLNVRQAEMSWDEYIDRLFCFGDITRLQVLCKECHKMKTDNENEERSMSRKVNGALKTLPEHVSREEAEALIDAIPTHIQKKITGDDIGELAKAIVSWFKSLTRN